MFHPLTCSHLSCVSLSPPATAKGSLCPSWASWAGLFDRHCLCSPTLLLINHVERKGLEKGWEEEQGQAYRADHVFLRHLMPFWTVVVPVCWQIPES